MEFFGDRHKVAEVPDLDIVIHIQNIIIARNKILDVSSETGQTGSMQTANAPEVKIREMRNRDDAEAFRDLNEEWITRYFTLEPKDREILEDPENAIVRKGGRVFLVHDGACAAVGCVALIPVGGGVYELSKMAVAPETRGRGIGRKLLAYAIAQARQMGAVSLFLGSNSRLENAVHLYESAGFRHVPPENLPATEYTRANVFMEMEL
jgi:N-acetylglutamate synthase-like GNAT family acetyltransferase